jgi:valyl-tRNA synthetase
MLPKGPYNSTIEEKEILNSWLENKYFKPEYHAEKGLLTTEEMKKDNRDSFCIVNPPPNAYMRPHIGNVSGYAYQDVFLRYNRLLGKKVLGQPGKDHAGIQGEVVVEKIFIKDLGKTKNDMGREEFYNKSYEHFQKLMPMVMADEQRIGLSSDYDRNLFTLDPKVVETVLGTFIKLSKDKMVYKGVRIVNWDPVAQTTLADIDTERVEKETELIYIKYKLIDRKDDEPEFIEVATTRAETMLGDTAIIVNPTDERYTKLVGRKVLLPIANREIPIITSPRVEKEFGTGAVKLTPAHSYDDYVMMNEWNDANPNNTVGYINIINKYGKMSGPIPEKYLGLYATKCRIAIIADLDELKLISKREPHIHSVMVGERSKAVIEQIMSSQWFIDVEKLKKPAIDVVESGEIQIHPKYMTKKYLNWMNNLKDWPVSRSLWWGYRIPVWYKGELTEEIDVSGQVVEKIGGTPIKDIYDAIEKGLAIVQIKSPGDKWIQDKDVFDTWFSSGQWPYATLIANDLADTFFPTGLMETGYDILEIWVSRMIMLSMYHEGKIPFKHVYLHGLVKATDGQKMSKSKNNVIAPEEIIEKYGADSLRLMYILGNKAGAGYPVSYEKLEGNKRFLNKIWNAAKFVEMSIEDIGAKLNNIKSEDLVFTAEDNTMLEHMHQLITDTTNRIEKCHIGIAAQELYESFWHTFADIYVEQIKNRLYTKDREGNAVNTDEASKKSRLSAQWTLHYCFKTYLKLLHPFIPFITEKIWQELPKLENESKTIMYSKWPTV